MKLFFIKFRAVDHSTQIVFLQTAIDEQSAIVAGYMGIADQYRDKYLPGTAEFVCFTNDEVNCFEPC